MSRTSHRSFAPRGILRSLLPVLGLLGVLLLVAGCSDDSPVPGCDNCGIWTQITAGLGRFPEPHPDPAFDDWFVFSTVSKDPTATDADKEADEDVWLIHVVDPENAAANRVWQLTDDTLGPGDNFSPRWAPSGGRIAFIHTDAGGEFQVWRMDLALPASDADDPVLGTPERIVADARDPAWLDDSTLLFTRGDKLFRTGVSGLRAGEPPVQLTYNPPSYTSTEEYVDRHPTVAEDGEVLFNTTGRRNVADVYVEAYERVSPDSVVPVVVAPEDPRGAWILFQAPTAPAASYPIFEGADTLRTPVLLQSVPVDAGGTFRVGVRIDSRFVPAPADTNDPPRETYCDTTIVANVPLLPGDIDTVRATFQVARGTLSITSGRPNTRVFWTRQDLRETSDDYLGVSDLIVNVGDRADYECVLVHGVGTNGIPDPNVLETFIVTGTSGGVSDTAIVQFDGGPGTTRSVRILPTGSISGVMDYSDDPPDFPRVSVAVYRAGTTDSLQTVSTNVTDGRFRAGGLLAGTYDLVFSSPRYVGTRVDGIDVPAVGDSVADVDIGAVPITALPTGTVLGFVAFSDNPDPLPFADVVAFTAGTTDSVAGTQTDQSTGFFLLQRLLAGTYDFVVSAPGYEDELIAAVDIIPPFTVDLGTILLDPGSAPDLRMERLRLARRFAPRVADARDAAPDERAPIVRRLRQAPPANRGASLSELLRAPGDVATLWRISFPPGADPRLREVLGSRSLLQSPALTENLATSGDLRYVAYGTNEDGNWSLRVQRIVDWVPDGSPYVVPTPGTLDNLFCDRSVFHPRWLPGSRPGDLRLVVALTDCPDNGFEDIGFDDNPWAVGELRVWEVTIQDYQ